MRRYGLRVSIVSLVVLHGVVGCAEPTPGADSGQLLQADRAFARDVAEGGSAAWVSWFAPDGAIVQEGVGEIRGGPAIAEAVSFLDQPGVRLSWEPTRADMAASDDLGWTTGRWTFEAPDDSLGVRRNQGVYVSIWRRQADGSWKVVMDLGNPTEPAEPNEGPAP